MCKVCVCWVTASVPFPLIVLKPDLSLKLHTTPPRLGWLIRKPRGYACLCIPSAEIAGVCNHVKLFTHLLEPKLRSPRLYIRPSMDYVTSLAPPGWQFSAIGKHLQIML